MKNKLYLLVQSGQMCNQLLSLGALLSLGIDKKCDVACNVVDQDLKKYFEFDSKDLPIQVNFSNKILGKVILLTIKVFNRIFKFKYSKIIKFKENSFFFLDWLSFLENEAFVRNVHIIREFFRIKDPIVQACKEKFEQFSRDGAITVGVHIRRGDYREFNDGIWCYEDESYIKWMKSLKLTADKNVKFLICSNENIDFDKFVENDLDVISFNGNAVEDLCYLSLCDYVMGPPSTFSFWAAMYGNKKRCILDTREKKYLWNDFKFFEERLNKGDYIR